MAERTDVVILGAGVVGLSAARHLAMRGARVTVLDPDASGGRGSRAAAGVAIPSVRLLEDPDMRAFTAAAKPVLASELEAVGASGLRRGEGILRPMPDDAARRALEAKAAAHPEWLGRWAPLAEVVELEPALRGASFMGAFLSDDGDLVDTHAYIAGLLADAARRGARIRLGEGARFVREMPEGVEVSTPSERIVCERLVVAAGAWSGQVPGLPELPIRPQRGQMLTVFHSTLRLSRIVSGPSYLAPWRSGEIVVGATEEDAGFSSHTTVAGLLHLSAALARLAPVLREARFVTAWAGLRSTAPSGHPLIGAYPGTQRVTIASGHGGQGILTGGLTGREVAALLDHGRSEVVAPFDPARALNAPAAANG